jgi:LPXTG-motif cell wall-anchored protein
VTGVTGSDAVTSVVVPAGEYQLSETGPGSYISDNGWSCDGSEESANVVLLSDGDVTTCTISNRYAEGVLNIAVVVSDPSNGLTNSTKVFAGTYVCGDAAPVAFTATVAAPFVVSDLPKGTSCTATETQPTGDLLNANYSWGTPTYSTRPVTIGDGTVATLTITNPIGFVAPTTTTVAPAPTTTTVAPAPTTTVVVTGLGGPGTTTSLPVSTVAPSALPTTGSSNTTSLVALAVALMVIGVALVRRRQWSDEV